MALSFEVRGSLRPFSSPDFICSLDKFKCDTSGVAVWSWEILCSVMHMFLVPHKQAKSFPKLARCLFLALLLAQMPVF